MFSDNKDRNREKQEYTKLSKRQKEVSLTIWIIAIFFDGVNISIMRQ